jgi:hypothetical protein
MKRRNTWRKALATALLAITTAPIGGLALPRQNSLSADRALRTMRLVATAEAALAANKGKGYGDLAAIAGELGSDARPITLTGESSGSALDYTLHVTVSADRRHFQASLTQTTGHGCTDVAWFVDDRWVIYTGHPIC